MARLAVLTSKPDLPLYRELQAAARAAGHRLSVLNGLDLVAMATPPSVWDPRRNAPVRGIAALLPRVGNWRPDSVLAVLAAFEASGVPVLNRPAPIRRGRDHWRTVAALAAAGLPHPETVAGAEPEALVRVVEATFAYPCVVKQRRSRMGVGVIRCASRAELEAVLDSCWRLGDEVIVQRFCPPGGVSRRVMVLDGEALGAAEHRAEPGEFRANAARGAGVVGVELDQAQADLAVAAAAVVGLDFAGIDLIPDGEGWVVGEVNPTPGWKHFAAATGLPVAERVVEALLRRAEPW
jgi:ribosomal protein S6--L-glutamate ligase